MKKRLVFLFISVLFSCQSKPKPKSNATSKTESKPITLIKDDDSNQDMKDPKIMGERLDGPANIRDGVYGKLLFSLDNHVLVSCTPLENDWYMIGIRMDIPEDAGDIRVVKSGRKIVVDGEEVGTLKADIEVYPQQWDKGMKAELIGYTHKNNIQPATIIENVLADYLMSDTGQRSFNQLKSFIQLFGMEKTDQFDGYTIYYNYENWIDDLSPMWRVGLVFHADKLVAILHSRTIDIPFTSDHKLGRTMACMVYNDVEDVDKIVSTFRQFVNTVD